MDPADALTHLVNLLGPGLAVAAISAGMTKLIWHRRLAEISWLRLAGWAGTASMLALIGGLLVFGRDGTMATYGAMLVANAAALWAVAFFRRGHNP